MVCWGIALKPGLAGNEVEPAVCAGWQRQQPACLVQRCRQPSPVARVQSLLCIIDSTCMSVCCASRQPVRVCCLFVHQLWAGYCCRCGAGGACLYRLTEQACVCGLGLIAGGTEGLQQPAPVQCPCSASPHICLALPSLAVATARLAGVSGWARRAASRGVVLLFVLGVTLCMLAGAGRFAHARAECVGIAQCVRVSRWAGCWLIGSSRHSRCCASRPRAQYCHAHGGLQCTGWGLLGQARIDAVALCLQGL